MSSEFLIMVDIFFNISPRTENLLSRQISKIKSIGKLDFLESIDQLLKRILIGL